MKYFKYLILILITSTLSYNLTFAQMNMNNKISNQLYLDNYLFIVKEITLRADSRHFDKEDKVFGKLSILAHKNNDYKVEKGLYENIPNIDDVRIILSKNRNENSWQSMRLLGISHYVIDILPNCDESFFYKELNLIKVKIEHDEDLGVYKYLYKTKSNTLIQFIVSEKQFNNETYPRNFQAIEVKWN